MKKLMAIVLAGIMTVSVCAICSSATSTAKDPNPEVTINKIATAPKIDGVVNDGEYGEKIHTTYDPEHLKEFDSQYDTDKSVNADFYACWDDKNLYLAWVVHTDHHNAPDSTPTMWLYSCIQFEIGDRNCLEDPNADVESLSIAVGTGSKNGKALKANQYQNNTELKSSMWKFAGTRDDTNNVTTYEVSYPWSTLNVTSEKYSKDDPGENKGFAGNGGTASEGTVIGLSYCINDTHNEVTNEGFWSDNNTVQWCNSITGIDADDTQLAIVTLGGLQTPVDPAPVDPAPVDPAPVDPAPVDPAPVDPAPVDPAPVDPAPVDPAPVDPAPVDPATKPDTTPTAPADETKKDDNGSSKAPNTFDVSMITGAAAVISAASAAFVELKRRHTK